MYGDGKVGHAKHWPSMTQRKYKVVRVKFAGSVTDDRVCFLKGRTLENNKYKFVLSFYVFEIGSM